jgi:uncharacterized protein YceH (UPF0502 family)
VHISALTAPEQRILGCLIEKRFTTPDQYPLSLNALRLAANQSTNRDPVVNYDESTINDAAQRLSRYGLVRLASGHSSRAVKYRHLAEEALGVGREELALLGVLLLRGPQTPGELKGRTERMVGFESLEAVDAGLEALAEKGYVARLPRRPGQKEERWGHRLGGDAVDDPEPGADAFGASAPAATSSVGVSPVATPTATRDLAARVLTLEAAVTELHVRLAALEGAPGLGSADRQPDQVGGPADDQAGQGHLEAG